MATVRRTYTGPNMAIMQRDNRIREENREDALKSLYWDQMQMANLQSEERADDRRIIRRMQLEQKERDMGEAITKAERDKIVKDEQQQQEEALARELEKMKLGKQRDEKMRQQIRETSIELRELEAQLKSGYLNKERAAQLAEKEALKYDKMSRDSEISKLMKEEHERAASMERQKELERYQEEVRYQQELERQLEEQELKKQQDFEETLKEKLMVDEIVRKIFEEDQREREKNNQKKDLEKVFVEEFKVQREEWKKKERERLEAENKNIARFAALQADREQARQAAKKEQEESRAHVQEGLSEKIADQRRAATEMEQVRQELYLEEQEEKERQRERAAEEKRLRDMSDLQRVHKEQLYFKKLREEAEMREEDEFRHQMMAKFAEDDRIEQMNANKRRLKQLEHKREVERLLEDRRAQFAHERERDLKERQHEEELEAFRKKIIEEERERLLKEHAPRLLGYLPKGVIRTERDLAKLGPDYQDAYSRREVDPLDDVSWQKK